MKYVLSSRTPVYIFYFIQVFIKQNEMTFHKKDPQQVRLIVDDRECLFSYWHIEQDCIMNADTSSECNTVIIGYLEQGINC